MKLHTYAHGRVRIAVQNIIDLTDDFNFQGHNCVKSHFGEFLSSY